MNFLHNLLVALQIIAALAMIGLVLVQHGRAPTWARPSAAAPGQPVRRHRQRQLPVALHRGVRDGLLRRHAGAGLLRQRPRRASAAAAQAPPGSVPAAAPPAAVPAVAASAAVAPAAAASTGGLAVPSK